MILLLPLLALLAQQSRDLTIERENPRSPFAETGSRWAVVIGVSQYEHLPPATQLNFAHRDAEAFAAFLQSPAGGALPPSHVRTLTNRDATLAAIRATLNRWLVDAAGPEDVVYIFFAGHGVVAERAEGYFLASDSDPQNLHATGFGFGELESLVNSRLKAKLVVLAADACHAGQLGWTAAANADNSRTVEALANLGGRDRAILKLLAARPSERSFEDARWGGGHGVFTFALLEGLRGRADRDADRNVRASEVIDFLAEQVPAQTASRQNPRVAGSFDPRVPLAILPPPARSANGALSLEVNGPAGATILVDGIYRGALSNVGNLLITGLAPGAHGFAASFVRGGAVEGTIRLSMDSRLELRAPAVATTASEHEAQLEQLGQACVSDYVQSTAVGPRQALLAAAVKAYAELKELRPQDRAIETRRLFCSGRLEIALGNFEQATTDLRAALLRDPDFACAHNALGVAYQRLGKLKEARASYDEAARLTPSWALPQVQIAGLLIAAGKTKEAIPYLERAVAMSPNATNNRWTLARAYRTANQLKEAIEAGQRLIRLAPDYAPGYYELARALDLGGDNVNAIRAYEIYLQLAPNYGDSDAVRQRSQQMRALLSKKDRAALEEK